MTTIACRKRPWAAALLVAAAVVPASAQEGEKNDAAPAQSDASAAILPIPVYAGDIGKRAFLTGDWGGARTDLARKGVQVGVTFNQYVQGVTDGGLDDATEYGGTLDYTIDLDLMRMGVLPGALIRLRAESRYGESVNGAAGTFLPVNTDALFPLTDEPDDDVPLAVTELNYTQFLSEHFAVLLGKLDTLDSDLNEFASGRGTSQFMNANFVFSPSVALRLPYSTLGGGVLWMPRPASADGATTVSSLLLNTADSSTSSGFDDFGKGVSWSTEADFVYREGGLPGGFNIGFLYSFDQEFARLDSRLVFQPGEGLSVPTKDSTWAVYWSSWQYLSAEEPVKRPIDLMNGRADLKGLGLFTRFGFADSDTNPVTWAFSGGVGGRGLVPSRGDDTFGAGVYWNGLEVTRFSAVAGLDDSTWGVETWYSFAVTPACHVTLDVQVIDSPLDSVHTATILGASARLDF